MLPKLKTLFVDEVEACEVSSLIFNDKTKSYKTLEWLECYCRDGPWFMDTGVDSMKSMS